MASSLHYMRLLVLLVTGISGGISIKCFQCSSQRDPGCAEMGILFATPKVPAQMINVTEDVMRYYKDCAETGNSETRVFFCRKMSQTIFARDKMEVVTRSCGWELHPTQAECYHFENKAHAETVCQCFEDGCNQASAQRVSFLVTLAVLVTVLCCS